MGYSSSSAIQQEETNSSCTKLLSSHTATPNAPDRSTQFYAPPLLQQHSSYPRNHHFLLKLTRIKDDLKRLLRTSKWHVALPGHGIRRSYPEPELSSLKKIQNLHKKYFGESSEFFEIDSKKNMPTKTAKALRKILTPPQTRAIDTRFIAPWITVLFENIQSTYANILRGFWNTEPENGCIGLLFSHTITLLDDSDQVRNPSQYLEKLEKLTLFLKAVIADNTIFSGGSKIEFKSIMALNNAIRLITIIRSKITEDANKAIGSSISELRNAFQMYLSETVDATIALIINASDSKKSFHIADPDSISSLDFMGFSLSLQKLLVHIHGTLIYNDSNKSESINDASIFSSNQDNNIIVYGDQSASQLFFLNQKNSLHPVFHNKEKHPIMSKRFIKLIDSFLNELNNLQLFYSKICLLNEGYQRLMQSIPTITSNVKQPSYMRNVVKISQDINQLPSDFRSEILQRRDSNDCISECAEEMRQSLASPEIKEKYRSWHNNYICFLEKKMQADQYLSCCSQHVTMLEKESSPEGTKQIQVAIQGIVTDLQALESASSLCLRQSSIFPAYQQKESTQSLETFFCPGR